jgi:hypothetical protein
MKTLLVSNLSTKLSLDGQSVWAPPVMQFGESLTIAQRYLQDVAGDQVEPALSITGVRASIGALDARPLSGTWALQVGAGASTGANTIDAVPYDVAPASLAAKINAKSGITDAYGAASVTTDAGSWVIVFGSGAAEVPMTLRSNRLRPISFGRISAYVVDGSWVHEIRLIQTPVASTSSGERILPPEPSITLVQDGGGDGTVTWNEIQDLYVPPDFRATFVIHWGETARTAELSLSDNADTIQAALEEMIGAGNITVTNPRDFHFALTFGGTLKGTNQPLMTIEALNPPPGDFTFTLVLDSASLAVALRLSPTKSITLPLEARITSTEQGEQVSLATGITIQAPLNWPELEALNPQDFIQPASPKDYIPFSNDTIITGHQFYPQAVGDGVATSFVLTHNLGTDLYVVFVRENVAGGRQLVQGTDFTVVDTNTNSATVASLTGAPASDAWLVIVVSAQTVAAFADGLTIEIGQVTGLEALLAAIGTQLSTIIAQLPTTPAGTATSGSGGIAIVLPSFTKVLPGTLQADGTVKPLGGLLPAIHAASVTSYTTGDLPTVAAASGSVYQNNSGAAILLPGGYGAKTSTLPVSGFFGSDGRRLYPLSQSGTSTSYFPADFELELFMFEVNAEMLRAGTTLTVSFGLALSLLQAITRAQWVLVIESAAITSDSSPATTAPNLGSIDWTTATPMLSQRIIVGPVEVDHSFGVQILRAADGSLTANKTLYGLTNAAAQCPATADFALRARLINFDTEDSITQPKGALKLTFGTGTAPATANIT